MFKSSEVVIIVLAGGSGSRFNNDLPKQLHIIDKTPVVKLTVDNILTNSYIDRVVVVVNGDFYDDFKNIFTDYRNLTIVKGGNCRAMSSYNGLMSIENDCYVLVHDGVRVNIKSKTIEDGLTTLHRYGLGVAVTTVIKSVDSMVESSSGDYIESLANREHLYRVQTPQFFHSSEIKMAMSSMKDTVDFREFNDDCSLYMDYFSSNRVYMVEGSEDNFKITYKEDLDRVK